MTRLVGLALGSMLVLTSAVALAAPPGPGQRFDCSQGGSGVSCASDDTGCVPQSKDVPAGNVSTLKCGDALGKAFGGAIRAVIKCHAKMADSVVKGAPVDDEACETTDPKSAMNKLDAAILKVSALCTSTQLTLAAAQESTLFASKSNPLSLDAQAGLVYCDGSTSIDPAGAGGDDAGTVDTLAADKSDRVKCADTTGSELGKLVATVIKCHIKLADSDFGGKDFDENLCEENDPVKGKSALQKYNAAGAQPPRARDEHPGPGGGGQPDRLSVPRDHDDHHHEHNHHDLPRRLLLRGRCAVDLQLHDGPRLGHLRPPRRRRHAELLLARVRRSLLRRCQRGCAAAVEGARLRELHP
ncbi:MAG: hypothetical protein E6J77_22480 [Deltaproteobacteria bacterium]|nr:MAG: hypothetical protein E6J77_22480 [Deltaproteobacteria bacterium]